ncbi:MAG: hypothetical protein A2539_08085 [Elusimicrobia bacterium RIFOXYD2_FULL_34_15]|nr:MAG: hypothetical protein A2539_08085 [Elusimicrobia bacterium RIFOXYD2_FULL_34_15]
MNKKILIVDDEVNVVELLKVNLEANKYNVITAYSGEEGLAKVETEHPDLIILDCLMPNIDGWEVCENIKCNSKTKNIPVIFLTAATQREDIERAKKSGSDFFVAKPFDPLDLIRKVKKIIK